MMHGKVGHDKNSAKQMSRSNTVDGKAQPLDMDSASGNPNGDRGGAPNQGRSTAGMQAAAASYSTATNTAQGRQIRTSLFVGPLSPLAQGTTQGNGKTSSLQANGAKKGPNGNANPRVGASGLANNAGVPANASAGQAKKHGSAQKGQGRDRVEVNPRAQSSDALPEYASPHPNREASGKSKQA